MDYILNQPKITQDQPYVSCQEWRSIIDNGKKLNDQMSL